MADKNTKKRLEHAHILLNKRMNDSSVELQLDKVE